MSRITTKQINYLATHPHAHMQFKATGKLPTLVTPASPLIALLETIPPRLRVEIRGVRLNPALGYMNGSQFHTAEQLLRWLKPQREMLSCESWPAESFRDKRFQRKLELSDLKPFCASWPGKDVLSYYGISE